MKDRTGEWIREQIKSFRVTWNQAPALPLSEWLTTETVARMVAELKFTGRDRVYTPLVTLWVFLSQVRANACHIKLMTKLHAIRS